MTQTEALLKQAADIAQRQFKEPSEAAILEVFRRLAYEFDTVEAERAEAVHALH